MGRTFPSHFQLGTDLKILMPGIVLMSFRPVGRRISSSSDLPSDVTVASWLTISTVKIEKLTPTSRPMSRSTSKLASAVTTQVKKSSLFTLHIEGKSRTLKPKV